MRLSAWNVLVWWNSVIKEWFALDVRCTTPHDVTSYAVQHAFHQDLKNAAHSLDVDPVSQRDVSTITSVLIGNV